MQNKSIVSNLHVEHYSNHLKISI